MEEPAAKDLYPGTFSRLAAAYKRRLDEVMARSESRGRDAVIDWVDPAPGKRILDLACGRGRSATEAELGPGPVQIAGATNVLRAIA